MGTQKREIILEKANYLETDVIPIKGDILFVGCRRELVVEDIPKNSEHGHLIRTAYEEYGESVERTYLVGLRETPLNTLTSLGLFRGTKKSILDNKN